MITSHRRPEPSVLKITEPRPTRPNPGLFVSQDEDAEPDAEWHTNVTILANRP